MGDAQAQTKPQAAGQKGLVGWLRAFAIAFVAVTAGYLARTGIDQLIEGQIPFATFFPAVIAAGLLNGFRASLIAVVLAVPVATIPFASIYPVATYAVWLIFGSVVALSAGLARELSERLRRERDELRRTRAKLELVIREQVHRAKNTFAVLSAVASQSAHDAQTVEEFRDRLLSRVRALSQAYGLLMMHSDAPVEVAEVVRTSLAPFHDAYPQRLVLTGEGSVMLPPSAAIPLTLCLHELATNAMKYGALSGAAGDVSCDWQANGDGTLLRWREQNGPAVTQPATSGFGSRMIRAALEGVGGGKTDLRFAPGGVECDLHLPGP